MSTTWEVSCFVIPYLRPRETNQQLNLETKQVLTGWVDQNWKFFLLASSSFFGALWWWHLRLLWLWSYFYQLVLHSLINFEEFSHVVSPHLVLHAEHLHGLPQLLLLLRTELLLCNLASSSVLFRSFSSFPWGFLIVLICLFFIFNFLLWPLVSFPW